MKWMVLLKVGLFLFSGVGRCDDSVTNGIADKKHQISVGAFFKNEARYLAEWIEYHRMIGVEHFYLYNNSSDDDSNAILAPYIQEGVVTVFDYPDHIPDYLIKEPGMWIFSSKLRAYENAAKYAALHKTEWLVFLDVDEFLVPVYSDSMSHFLDGYSEYSAIELPTYFFRAEDSSENILKQLLIESIHLIGEGTHSIEKKVNKVVFKPRDYTHFKWPPYQCQFKAGARVKRVNNEELRLNKYRHRQNGSLNFGKTKRRLQVDHRMLGHKEMLEVLQMGYEIEDQEQAVSRFVPSLKQRLGLDTISR